jgi:hypothetical protein
MSDLVTKSPEPVSCKLGLFTFKYEILRNLVYYDEILHLREFPFSQKSYVFAKKFVKTIQIFAKTAHF